MSLEAVFDAVYDISNERGVTIERVELGADAMRDVIREAGDRAGVAVEDGKPVLTVMGPMGPLELAYSPRLVDHIIAVDTAGERWPY